MRYDSDAEERPSRSARKRSAQAVEDLARALVDLPPSALERLPAGAEIRREVEQARSIRAHGARDRQIRHLASVLRRDEDEVAALRVFLAGEDEGHYREQAAFHRLEVFRDRLCHPGTYPEALSEAASLWPTLDTAAVGRLARACHASEDRRAFREIFRLLRRAAEGEHSGP